MKMKPRVINKEFAGNGSAATRTKVTAMAMLFTASLVQAEIIEFDLSPAGSDTAVGLSPANEVSLPVPSTGSGNEISGGITFDTSNSTLSFSIGYGSSTGFTDLTGIPTVMHIHGPAAVGTNGPVLFNLAPVHFAAPNPAQGGVIFGSIVYTPEQAEDLLAGLNYVNIHTAQNPGGEIRGQLIPLLNTAPEIVCPADATVECGVSFTYTASVLDPDGDAAEVVWSLNGEAVQVDDVAAGGTVATELEYTATLPLGVNALTVTATDSEGNSSSCTSTITVEDTTPPVIVSASVNPKELWPANHKMVPVKVSATVTDTCSETTWKIVSISSSEPEDIIGSGNTAPDWQITGDATANLRAERSGTNKAGRTYTIVIEATDASGNVSSPASVTVKVPHSKGKSR
jgi:hypothetical protein